MPLEISEISIRMAVGDAVPLAAPPSAVGEGEVAVLDAGQVDELVRRCVAEVMAALRSMGDR